MRIRNAIAGVALGIALVGGAYGVYALLNAIMNASPLSQFLIATGGFGGGGLVAYLSVKDRVG